MRRFDQQPAEATDLRDEVMALVPSEEAVDGRVRVRLGGAGAHHGFPESKTFHAESGGNGAPTGLGPRFREETSYG